MANPEHLEIINKGTGHWNRWRRANPDIKPDLSGADLSNRDLRGVNFRKANLNRANLSKSKMIKARLENANLFGAHLENAILWEAHLEHANLKDAHIEHALLWNAHLEHANLTDAHLEHANLTDAHLEHAKLQIAHLEYAFLWGAHLENANLGYARLENASLWYAHLEGGRIGWEKWHKIPYKQIIKKTCISGADFKNADVTGIHYNRWMECTGAKVNDCSGSLRFKRFVQDQEYIEEFRSESKYHYFMYLIWLVFADCGRSLLPWIFWSLFAVFGFAWKFYSLGSGQFKYTETLGWDFWTMLYYSVVTFTTLGFGDITPLYQTAAWWVMAEVITGYVMLGGLISIFANKLARRAN